MVFWVQKLLVLLRLSMFCQMVLCENTRQYLAISNLLVIVKLPASSNSNNLLELINVDAVYYIRMPG